METNIAKRSSSFLRQNLDHIVGLTFFGGMGAAHIISNIAEYVQEGHQLALEKGVAQALVVTSTVAMYYAFIHYYRS